MLRSAILDYIRLSKKLHSKITAPFTHVQGAVFDVCYDLKCGIDVFFVFEIDENVFVM